MSIPSGSGLLPDVSGDVSLPSAGTVVPSGSVGLSSASAGMSGSLPSGEMDAYMPSVSGGVEGNLETPELLSVGTEMPKKQGLFSGLFGSGKPKVVVESPFLVSRISRLTY